MPLATHTTKPLLEAGPLLGLIEDDPVMGQSMVDWFQVEGYRTIWWRNGRDAIAGLKSTRPDILICDIRLPDMTGEDIIRASADRLGQTPFLAITAFGDVAQAVRLMKSGAADYVTKPFDIEDLLRRVEGLLSQCWTLTEGWTLGQSRRIISVEQVLRRAASIDSTVLLTGPSGSGKEVAARLLHDSGPRSRLPFHVVNCAAVPKDQLEAELFGYERGAFPGSHQRRDGIAERVGGGTLLLDEIAEMPLEVQTKLLRVLEERTFKRGGGDKAQPFRARLVATTSADLKERVSKGQFREALFFRLAVIVVEMPALRDRPEDIIPLARRFVAEFARTFGRPVSGIAPLAEEALRHHPFPGNIRELRNRIERAVALGERDWLTQADLFPELQSQQPAHRAGLTLALARDVAEKRTIEAALKAAGDDVERAAMMLDVSRSTLFAKIRKLEIRS